MDEDINIKPTETGKLMARYCVAFDTVRQFSEVTGTETLPELIEMISKGKEFSDVQLRVNEKKTLNMLNKDKNRTTIRYPMEGKIKSNDMKVNCLIQAQLGCIPIQEFGLIQDTGKIFRNAIRVSKYLTEFLRHHSQNNFSAQLNSLILAKCFRAKLWENSPYVSKQLEKIGQSFATAMVNAGLTTFSKIEETSPRELELIVNRHPPFGNQIKEAVCKLPKHEVNLEQIQRYNVSTAEIVVTVNLKNFKEMAVKQTASDHHHVTLIIGDCDNNVVFQQKIMDALLLKSGKWSKRIEVGRISKGEEINIHLISSEYVGLDIQKKCSTFFIGEKTFGTESHIIQSPIWRMQRVLKPFRENPVLTTQTNRVHSPRQQQQHDQSSGTEPTGISCINDQTTPDTLKRQCNHLCRNKELCGHECCKVGVEIILKRPANQSSFSSYLKDMKMRNVRLTETPVKRLKMMMNNETPAIGMQQFSYKPKEALPAVKKIGVSQCYTQSRCENPELEEGFVIPNDNSSFEGYDDYMGGFYSEIGDLGQATSSAQEVLCGQLKTLKHKRMDGIISQKADVYSTHTNPEHCSDWAGTLNVTFDLGVNDWDDFDDGHLLRASELCCETKACDLKMGHHQPTNAGCLSAVGQTQAQTKQETLRSILPIRIDLPVAATPQTRVCSEISMNTHSNQRECKKTSLLDIFSRVDTAQQENIYVNRECTKDSNNEADVYIDIFDGLL